MNIELRQLKHAVAVAEHASFARAALELHLSQSALSRSIQALEREVGTPIFLRSAGGVVMTDVGRQLLQHAKGMLRMAADLDRTIVRNRSLQTGRLTVGIATAPMEPATTRAVRGMLQEQPMVAVEIRTGFRNDLLPALRGGELDLLIADSTAFVHDDPELELQPLEEHPLVVVVRAGHPLARRRGVALPELFAYPVVASGRLRPDLLSSVLEEQSRADETVLRRAMPSVVSNSPTLARRLVLCSDAVVAFPPDEIAGLVESGDLLPIASPAWLTSPVGVVWMRPRPPRPIALAFLNQLKDAHSALVSLDRQRIQRWLEPAAPGQGKGPA